MTIINEIAAERERQIHSEGYDRTHDDAHDNGDLALAAALYASPIQLYRRTPGSWRGTAFFDPWPWEEEADKRQRHDRRHKLVIAAALIVAEIERLDRKAVDLKDTA